MPNYGYLSHHGIKGQKWGIRRYQNTDGTLTPAGRERYYKDRVKQLKTEYYSKTEVSKRSKQGLEKYIRKNYGDTYFKDRDLVDQRRTRRIAVGVLSAGAVAAGAVLTTGALAGLGEKSLIEADSRNRNTDFKQRVNNILNDKDEIEKLEADKKLYRIIFGSEKDKHKIINESTYTTDNPADRALYNNYLVDQQSLFGSSNNKKEVTYETNKDIYVAKGKLLFDFALEAIGSDKKVDDLNVKEIQDYADKISGPLGGLWANRIKAPEGASDFMKAENAIFRLMLKDASGNLKDEDSKKLRKKLLDWGYNAVKDYTDSGILSDSPKILLNASEDVNIDKIKEITDFDTIKANVILGLKKKGK